MTFEGSPVCSSDKEFEKIKHPSQVRYDEWRENQIKKAARCDEELGSRYLVEYDKITIGGQKADICPVTNTILRAAEVSRVRERVTGTYAEYGGDSWMIPGPTRSVVRDEVVTPECRYKLPPELLAKVKEFDLPEITQVAYAPYKSKPTLSRLCAFADGEPVAFWSEKYCAWLRPKNTFGDRYDFENLEDANLLTESSGMHHKKICRASQQALDFTPVVPWFELSPL
jgi:hypothetical protein